MEKVTDRPRARVGYRDVLRKADDGSRWPRAGPTSVEVAPRSLPGARPRALVDHSEAPRQAWDAARWPQAGPRSPKVASKSCYVPIPEHLLAIARPSEKHRMHQDGPELAQDRLKLLPKAAKMAQRSLGTGTLKVKCLSQSTC